MTHDFKRPSPAEPPRDPADIYVVGCRDNATGETWIVKFTPGTRAAAIRTVQEWGRCKSLSLSAKQAAAIRERILEECPT